MTVPLRAVLYLRVSTARQAEHDVSIPDQKRQGEAYCASRGYQLVEACVEPGASATNDHALDRRQERSARQRIRLVGGGYRRDHLRALAQRVEVAEGEVRIMGSKFRLLQTLVANGSVNSAPTQGLKWRMG